MVAFLPLVCRIKNSCYFLIRENGSELSCLQDFIISIFRISLPVFPFEFSVEKASNRMIDIKGLIKVLKQIQLSFINCFSFAKL